MPRGAVLVGRADELTMLTERLAAARGGTGGLVLMTGEPGIGKTRLAQELAELSDRQGVAVAWGRCREDGGAPAYFPWVQIVKRIAERTGLAAGELGRRWPKIASLVGISPSVEAPPVEPAERFRLFASVASLLEHCAGNRGLVVIIDDLHRADEGSLALLRFLAPDLADMRVLMVAAYRDSDVEAGQSLAGTIGRIADGSNVLVVRLSGLDAHEVAGLIYRHAGSVSADVVEAVATRTAGNPFFVIEMAALLRSTTTSAESVARTALPATVREVIGQRVARLAAETQQALRAAAVLGREFGRLRLADMLATSELAVAAALQPAASAGLISAGSEGGGYRFVHALVQAAIYDAVPLPRRTELHGRAAEAIASAGALGDEQISDLAFHSYHAALDGDPGPARERTLAAGRRAGQRLAFEDAARWLSLALELAEREPVRAQDLLQLLLEAADADRCAGLVSSARARYERAAQIARQLEDRSALIRAALGIGSAVVTAGRVDWDLAALLEEAAKAAASKADRAQLESRLAIELYWHEGGEPSRAQSLAALRTAERSNDPAALGVALHARQFTLRSPGHLGERIDIGERLLALAKGDRHGELAFQGAVWLAADVMRAGDLTRFRGLAELLQAAAARSHLPLQRWYATVMAAQLASVEGRVEKACELAEGAAVLGARLGLDIAAAYRLGQLCVLHREREGLHSLIPDIEGVSARLPYFVTIRGFAALAAATTGHCDAAAWEINRVSGNGFDAIPRDSLWVATIALFTEAAAICGSPHTSQLAELLAPHRGTFVVQGIPCCWGSVDRFLGRAAIAVSDWDAAASALTDAADMEAKLAAPLFAARTTLDQARLAAATGERDNARRLATQVRAAADRLGLAALSREAAQLLATPNDQSRLSRREREVLGLLSGGATNKEIAARLVISLNTVERHLANIYTKLGVRGRAEAAAYAVRAGLEMTAGNGGSP